MASSGQTTHFHLPEWAAMDKFLRKDFNESYHYVDTALAELESGVSSKSGVVVGAFTGDGLPNQWISLGLTPRAVLVEQSTGVRCGSINASIFCGLALEGHSVGKSAETPIIAVESGGFRVYSYEGGWTGINNSKGTIYYFLAFV